MPVHLVPLVGAHFRPPAKALLSVLPARCPLRIVPEPDNPHDANALRVEVASADIPQSDAAREQLVSNALLLPYGFTIEELMSELSWHLGYVKATEAAWLAPLVVEHMMPMLGEGLVPQEFPEFLHASLAFDASGRPVVRLDLGGTP